MILKKYVILFVSTCVLLLSGCAVLRTPNPSERFVVQTPIARQAELSKIQYWKIEGAFSITQANKRPEIANYSWFQLNPKSYRISISSALGLYHVQINREFGMVTLWKNGVHVSSAKTPEGLMQKALGWSLPIHELSSWIKGEPAKHAGFYVARYDAYGHLTVLQQKGWILHYSAYRKSEYDVDFPRVVVMERPGILVKIVTRDWFLFMQPNPELEVK